MTGKAILQDVERYVFWQAGTAGDAHPVVAQGVRQRRSVADGHQLLRLGQMTDPVVEATELYRFFHAGDDEVMALRGRVAVGGHR